MDAGLLGEVLARRPEPLTSLRLHNNYGIKDLGVQCLAPRAMTTGLVDLQLSYCQIGPRGGACLGTALRGSLFLSSLQLTGNYLGIEGMVSVLEGAAHRDVWWAPVRLRGPPNWRPPLLSLGLAANHQPAASSGEAPGGLPRLDRLCEALRACRSLSVVDLRSNSIPIGYRDGASGLGVLECVAEGHRLGPGFQA